VSGARGWTLVDGSFREGADVPMTDRGFRYGMSVFETLAVREGRILFLEEHLAALEAACRAAGFRSNKAGALTELGTLPDGLLRIYVTAGDGPPTATSGSDHRTFVLFERVEFPDAEALSRGARVTRARAPFVPVLGGWKTGNYWQNVMSLAAARENGFDETLIVNIEGVVISAAMANVFFLVAGVLQTPAAQAGARGGIIRGWVQEMIPVEETLPSVADVSEAEECFLTNSRLGVMPVSEIDGRRLPSRKTGEALAALYRERILRL
jgi:branched-subunit amino acid aminotransferase/4-amino-4-deoxychorismate lyase